jgi:hypothetical protein
VLPQTYETTAGNTAELLLLKQLAAGYGGQDQEPLYETIPGEVVTPTQSKPNKCVVHALSLCTLL